MSTRLLTSSPARPPLWIAPLARCRWASTTSSGDDLIVKLRTGLKESMKNKDKLRTNTIKSALADIQNSQHLASPPAPLKTLRLALSRRIEASAASRSASPPRQDLADGYDAEAKVLEDFLPSKEQMMGETELNELVDRIANGMEGVKEEGQKALGRIVKKVRDEVGDRAEGKEIAAAVKKYLSQ